MRQAQDQRWNLKTPRRDALHAVHGTDLTKHPPPLKLGISKPGKRMSDEREEKSALVNSVLARKKRKSGTVKRNVLDVLLVKNVV
jgi:hypothetical protein